MMPPSTCTEVPHRMMTPVDSGVLPSFFNSSGYIVASNSLPPDRWTPPCCQEHIRETIRYAFSRWVRPDNHIGRDWGCAAPGPRYKFS